MSSDADVPLAGSTRSGRIAAALLFASAIAYGIAGATIEYSFSSDPLGPTAFPLLLALALAVLAVWYALQPGESEAWPTGAARLDLVLLVAATALFVRLVPVLGFPVAISLLCTIVARQFGASRPIAAVIGVAQGFGWWIVFFGLGVPLPLWPSAMEASRLLTNPLGV